MRSSSTTSSTSPVGMLGLMVSASRFFTVPMAAIYEFVAQLFGLFVDGGVQFGVEDDLRYAGAVAEIDEDDLAEVAAAVDPSHEDGFFACVGEAQGPAHMSSS